MDRAPDFESVGCAFESRRGHLKNIRFRERLVGRRRRHVNTEFALPQGRRFSRKRLQVAGGVLAGLAIGIGAAILFITRTPPPETLVPLLDSMGIAVLFEAIYRIWRDREIFGVIKAFTVLHEGAHVCYACIRGVPLEQVSLVPNTARKFMVSLNMRDIPKGIWVEIMLFPLVLPLAIAVLGLSSGMPWPWAAVLTLVPLAGSGSDLVYAAIVWKTPGDFVTATESEIIVY